MHSYPAYVGSLEIAGRQLIAIDFNREVKHMRHIAVIPLSLAAFEVLLIAPPATAAPTAECRNLAKQFGERPEGLGRSDLTFLRTCVTEEISRKLVPGPVVAPAPALSRPPLVLAPAKPALPALDEQPAAAVFSPSSPKALPSPKK